MSDITNLSFETAALDGISPASWTITTQASEEAYAVWSDGATVETFEGWTSVVFTLTGTQALFSTPPGDPQPQEPFEGGWTGNDGYLRDLGGAEAEFVFFRIGGDQTAPVETFENEWAGIDGSATGYFLWWDFVQARDAPLAWPNPTTEAAPISGLSDGLEPFESGWENDTYYTDWGSTPSINARFDGPNELRFKETFEAVNVDVPVSVAAGSWHWPAHLLQVDDLVSFRNDSGQLPAGISPGVRYYVVNLPDADHFEVSATSGGSVLVPTDSGTGVTYGTAPTEFWTSVVNF